VSVYQLIKAPSNPTASYSTPIPQPQTQHFSNSIQSHDNPAALAAYKHPNTQQQTTVQCAQHTNQRPTALRSPQHQQLNSLA
jgi:hypothetical protein